MNISIPTVCLTIRIYDQDGGPVPGTYISAKLSTIERYKGYIIPEEYTGVTDESGVCVIKVFPNELGTEGSEYRIKMRPPSGKSVTLYATVPNTDCNLEDICDLEPYAVRGSGEIITAQVMSSAESARQAAQEARSDAQYVQVNINTATEGARRAETAREHAETQASIATAKAGVAEVKASFSASSAEAACVFKEMSKAWAESHAEPDPDNSPGSKSAKAWAEQAGHITQNLPVTAADTTTARTLADRFADVINVKDFGAVGDGVVNDTVAIQAAINHCVSTGDQLYWPVGTYISTSTYNFHAVQHAGSGVIKRGDILYTVQPWANSDVINTIYVSPSGNDTHDGFSTDTPKKTIQSAFDALVNVGHLYGEWVIQIAAGTYAEFATLSGVQSYKRVSITGPDVQGGEPSVVLDGSAMSASSVQGMLLTNGVYAKIANIYFRNWTGATGVGTGDASKGLNVSYADVWADNCWFDSCGTGFYATQSRVYQGRGRVTNCAVGSMAFASTHFSFGYNGDTVYTDGTVIGITFRDASSGVIDGGVFNGCDVAVKGLHQSISRVSNCKFQNSTISDVFLYTASSVFFGDGNTHTPNKILRTNFALPLGDAAEMSFFGDTKRWAFGEVATPAYKWHFRRNITNSYASSNASLALEADSPLIALNGRVGGIFGLYCAIPGTQEEASILYVQDAKNWRIRAGNTEVYRLAANALWAVVDNAASLGQSYGRWSVIYAATGTINTSDRREKQQIQDYDDIVLDAWGDVQFRAYLFNSAVAAKGDSARIHAGVVAQQVIEAFAMRGLDATRYALLCYDKWEDEWSDVEVVDQAEVINNDTGEIEQERKTHVERKLTIAAGERYGIRYEEALCLEAAYQRRRAARMEARIAALEAAIKPEV